MKTTLLFPIIAGLALLTALISDPVQLPKPTSTGYEPVAVLELFTSQGCSSCPPADRLLAQTVSDAQAKNQRVFGLSFHVDYWDHLGWQDPFSSAQATERQRQYVRRLHLSSLYTPQVVVNGQQEFVGSSAGRMQSSLMAALAQPATVRITGDAPAWNGPKLTLGYRLDGETAGVVLHAALIGKAGANEVPRGENAGRRLQSINAVRAFQSVASLSSSGKITLTAPADFDRANGSVVLFVQAADGRVRGASEVAF